MRLLDFTIDSNEDSKVSVPENTIALRQNKYIAFNNGELLPDVILDWIINLALRGKMTASGAQLLLIPDTRKGLVDSSGLRQIGKFRKADCLTLKQLISKNRRKSRSREKTKKRSKKDNEISNIKIPKSQSGTYLSDRHFLQKERCVNELKNTSAQVSP